MVFSKKQVSPNDYKDNPVKVEETLVGGPGQKKSIC